MHLYPNPVFCRFLVFSPCSLFQHARELLHAEQEHLILQNCSFILFIAVFFLNSLINMEKRMHLRGAN